jgi:hypothetical protein
MPQYKVFSITLPNHLIFFLTGFLVSLLGHHLCHHYGDFVVGIATDLTWDIVKNAIYEFVVSPAFRSLLKGKL